MVHCIIIITVFFIDKMAFCCLGVQVEVKAEVKDAHSSDIITSYTKWFIPTGMRISNLVKVESFLYMPVNDVCFCVDILQV
jgi:hypothetical protein